MKAPIIATVLTLTSKSLADTLYECDGLRKPDFKAADKFLDLWANDATGRVSGAGPGQECKVYTKSDYGNFAVRVCVPGDGDISVAKRTLAAQYEHILKKWCEPVDAGGKVFGSDGVYDMAVYNNPDFTGSESSKLKRRAIFQRRDGDGIVETTLSVKDANELFGLPNSGPSMRRMRRQILPGGGSKIIEGAKKVAGKNGVEDDSFDLLYKEMNVVKPKEKYQASNILDPGIEETWTVGEQNTVGVSTSASVSAGLFDIFSASVEISATQEHTETIESGMTFKSGDCPEKGIVYWHPLFDHYVGYFSSDPDTEFHAWIPVALGDNAAGRWNTECVSA